MIQQQLHAKSEFDSIAADALALIQAYLPEHIRRVQGAEDVANVVTGNDPQHVISVLHDGAQRYVLVLPPTVHALLIENTGALLAA